MDFELQLGPHKDYLDSAQFFNLPIGELFDENPLLAFCDQTLSSAELLMAVKGKKLVILVLSLLGTIP
jgi:hypothetical protein